jgi:hypothetical protein
MKYQIRKLPNSNILSFFSVIRIIRVHSWLKNVWR